MKEKGGAKEEEEAFVLPAGTFASPSADFPCPSSDFLATGKPVHLPEVSFFLSVPTPTPFPKRVFSWAEGNLVYQAFQGPQVQISRNMHKGQGDTRSGKAHAHTPECFPAERAPASVQDHMVGPGEGKDS